MKELNIRWQRLLNESNQTCPRCGTTEAEVERAIDLLRQAMKPLGVAVLLEKEALSPEAFAAAPLESNRIWVGGAPMESWLAATSGKSQCCDACGDADCRTMTVDGKTYEAIPAELIVQAGLLAAARLLAGEPADGCCDSSGKPSPAPGCALPSSQCECG
jgi:anti-sigma factor RsiW